MDFAVPADNRVKIKESWKMDKYLDLLGEGKKLKREGDGDWNCSWSPWNSPQRPGKEVKETGD